MQARGWGEEALELRIIKRRLSRAQGGRQRTDYRRQI